MRKAELSRFRKELEALLAAAAHHGAAAAQDLSASGEELPDPNDRASRESDLESELRLADRERQLVPKIRIALQRIEEGTFGLCISCGEPIPMARLRARPVTDLCIECKREAERSEARPNG
ncbi:MAG TPA: TraR/DksA C4-type zinc finger protein [Anaeromyxobacteraceae bacterium]|nr:TraR/DksA C4-type zinc finger protein [Anaeromyxobacteraceae bacterium]